MHIELTSTVDMPTEHLIDLDRAAFLSEIESSLGSPIPVDALTYTVHGTSEQNITFRVTGTVDEMELNEALDAS